MKFSVQILAVTFWLGVFAFGISRDVCADVIHFINGDRLSGIILESGKNEVVIESEIVGILTLSRENIKRIQPAGEQPKIWNGKMSGSFDLIKGNTETAALGGGIAVKRKVVKKNEFDFSVNGFYGSSDKKMNAQRYDAMIRYAYSFGRSKKWYHFYKTEADHDRFANINARMTPSTGIGYWFWDEPSWKLMSELGVGVTMTNYRDDRKNTADFVLIPRVYVEKTLRGKAKVSEDFTAYPSLTNAGEYRLKSETALTTPVAEDINLKVSWINLYNSHPGGDTKKLDQQLLSSLEYQF